MMWNASDEVSVFIFMGNKEMWWLHSLYSVSFLVSGSFPTWEGTHMKLVGQYKIILAVK